MGIKPAGFQIGLFFSPSDFDYRSPLIHRILVNCVNKGQVSDCRFETLAYLLANL